MEKEKIRPGNQPGLIFILQANHYPSLQLEAKAWALPVPNRLHAVKAVKKFKMLLTTICVASLSQVKETEGF
ncbi:MAG TPA: hypothetical protein VHM28_10595 [Anaerolineales bacterium]|nr:hypothetical protein [Anaerolineales bacterium]